MNNSIYNRVAIIGSGFMGVVTAIRLLLQAEKPLEIILIEKIPEQRYGGIAYGENTTEWEYVLNIQAGRISLFREAPDDFLNWVNYNADKSVWPSKYRDQKFYVYSAVPRKIYKQYLEIRLFEAERDALPYVFLTKKDGNVVDIEETNDKAVIYYDDGSLEPVAQVIIATGHQEFKLPEFVTGIQDNYRFISSPFTAKFKKVLKSLNLKEDIFVIGSGLTAFDVVVSLLNIGHEGRIILCSRNGFTHATYRSDHQHEIFEFDPPEFLQAKTLNKEIVVKGFTDEYRKQFKALRIKYPALPKSIIPERILKGWEPYLAQVVKRLLSSEVRDLLQEYKSRLVTFRTSVVPEIGNLIKNAKKRGQLEVVAASINQITPCDNGTGFMVDLCHKDGTPKLLSVDAVVNAIGVEADYTKVQDPLWRNLIDKRKLATPHEHTGLGIMVGEYGELINEAGNVSNRIIAVGPMRQGTELERNGRIGAFVFSIGTLRNQALFAALTVLRRLDIDHEISFHSGGAPHQIVLIERIQNYMDEMKFDSLTEVSMKIIATPVSKRSRELCRELEKRVSELCAHVPYHGTGDRLVRKHILYEAKFKAAHRITDISKIAGYYGRLEE